MKLERERDIPALKGKSWREKMALRGKARDRDISILRLEILGYLLFIVPMVVVETRLLPRLFSVLVFVVIYLVFSTPACMLFRSLFITPRIRRALETEAKPST
jgi:hypothetical protein